MLERLTHPSVPLRHRRSRASRTTGAQQEHQLHTPPTLIHTSGAAAAARASCPRRCAWPACCTRTCRLCPGRPCAPSWPAPRCSSGAPGAVQCTRERRVREGRGGEGGGGHEELHRVREGWGDGGEDPGKKSNVTCLLGQAPGPPDAVGWVGYTLL